MSHIITNTDYQQDAERPVGISAFIRCRNEEEFILPAIMSIYRVVDEILVVLNGCSDNTPEIVKELAVDFNKIRIAHYTQICSPIGQGYAERVARDPDASLARYYNWCTARTRFSHVCKWDGDMIATPAFDQARALIATNDVVLFDGHDVLAQETTSLEPRIFKYDRKRARYVDWDLYEVIEYDYAKIAAIEEKCYLHMKLVKRSNLGSLWKNPNELAERAFPAPTGPAKMSRLRRFGSRAKRILTRISSH